MIEQLNAAHKSFIEELKAEHASELESKLKALEKTINNQSLELKATQDDLAKAKSALTASAADIDVLKRQLEAAEKTAAVLSESSASEHASEVQRLAGELAAAQDDVNMFKQVLEAQKGSMSEMSSNHGKELELAAKARAEEVTKLRAEHEYEKTVLNEEKSALASRVSDLEGELATLQAKVAASETGTAAPKSNGISSSDSTGVSKEDLQKLHEAHNLKLNDVEAEHERAVKNLREELETVSSKTDELQNEVGRKSMEVQYLESEVEEKDDTITRYVKFLKVFANTRVPTFRFKNPFPVFRYSSSACFRSLA